MSGSGVRLVHSPDPDLLVRLVFDDLARYQKDWPDFRAFVLVPEHMKADMERGYLTRHRSGGLMMAEVLSFNRLASRLFAEAGRESQAQVSRAGKAVLAQKALLDDRIPFSRFHRLAGKPRYAGELVKILGDFNRYHISSGDLRDLAWEEGGGDRASLDKFQDFALLKEALDRDMDQLGLVDPDQHLGRLALLLEEGDDRLAFLSRTRVWVLGFGNDRDFTSQEKRLLEIFAVKLDRLTIAVTADRENDSDPLAALRRGRQTLAGLRASFPGADLSFLPSPKGLQQKTCHFIRSRDRREEARYTAGEIRRLLLEEGLRRRDIGIALCERGETVPYLEKAFEDYGIDAYLDTGRPLARASVIRMLTSFLSLCDYDFSLQDLLDYYKSGLSGLDNRAIDAFENASLALAWRRAADFRRLTERDQAWQEALKAYVDPRSLTGRAIGSVIKDVKEVLEAGSQMRKRRSGQAKCEFLLDFLLESSQDPQDSQPGLEFPRGSLADRVRDRRNRLLAVGRDEHARLLVSAWNALTDLIREMGVLMGQARVSQVHFRRMLEAGLEDLALASIPAGLDRVRVGSPGQMASFPCKVLFILGMTEGAFPPESKQEGFLTDDERILLAEKSGKSFPNRRKDQAAAQAWLVHALLNRPGQYLYLSTPGLGPDSSRIYDDLLARSGRKELVLNDYDGRVDPRWYAPVTAFRQLRWNNRAPREWQEAVTSLLKDMPAPLKGPDSLAAGLLLPPPLVTEVMKGRDGISVSMLQTYNACPFSFFIRYLAGASERKIARDGANLQGTLLHKLMEGAVRDLLRKLEETPDPVAREALALAWEKGLDPACLRPHYLSTVRDPDLSWYGEEGRAGGIGDRLMGRAADTLASLARFSRQGSYFPLLLEWYFPQRDLPPYRLEARGLSFTCRGLVDRIDANPLGLYRIIDYKRSPKDFSWLDLADGTDIQLPLYKRAFETARPGARVGDMLFAGWKRPQTFELGAYKVPEGQGKDPGLESLQKQAALWEGEGAEKVAAFAEARAVQSLESILTGHFPAKPLIRGTRSNPCSYCPLKAACAYDSRLERNRPLGDTAGDREASRARILGSVAEEGGSGFPA